MNRVSVYIPSYNGAKYLRKCLEGVLKQTYPINEIIVVDDGSSDNTAKVASGYPVRLIKHKHNRGIAAARNTAVQQAKGDFIASIDADCLPEPTWLRECMKNFLKNNTVAVGGKLVEISDRGIKYNWRATHLKQHKVLSEQITS